MSTVIYPSPVFGPVQSRRKIILWVVFAAVVAFAAIFMAVAHVAPELLDKILYTPEELEILNYKSE